MASVRGGVSPQFPCHEAGGECNFPRGPLGQSGTSVSLGILPQSGEGTNIWGGGEREEQRRWALQEEASPPGHLLEKKSKKSETGKSVLLRPSAGQYCPTLAAVEVPALPWTRMFWTLDRIFF